MTLLVDPKLKRSNSVVGLTDDHLVSKKQALELLDGTSNLLADVFKVSGSTRAVMLWIGNTIYGWGDSDNTGRIFGFADDAIDTPTRLSNFEANPADIVDIAAGTLHSIVVLSDGTAWIAGSDSNGQIGDASVTGTTETWTRVTGPWEVGSQIVKCWAFHNRSFLLVNEGGLGAYDPQAYRMYVTGRNNRGQCGDNTVIDIPTWTFTLAIFNGTTLPFDIDDVEVCGNLESTHVYVPNLDIWSVGNNDNGQLGLGDVAQRNLWAQTVVTSGLSGYPGVLPRKLFATDRGFGIIGTDDNVYVAGFNASEVLGIAGGANVTSWTASPGLVDIKDAAGSWWDSYADNHTGIVAIKNDGTLRILGNSGWGHLGIEDTSGYIFPAEDIPLDRTQGTKFIAIWNVGLTKFLLDEVGNIWSFGNNIYRQVGLGFDSAFDDDYISAPLTVSIINNARLELAFQNITRGYSHPIIPHYIEQTIIAGSSDVMPIESYQYRETTNTPPIAAVAADWVKVPLNTPIHAQIAGSTLDTNGVILPAGDYQLTNAWCNFDMLTVGQIGLRVRDISNSSDIAFITTVRGNGFTEDSESFRLEIPTTHEFTLASPARIELQAYKSDTRTLGSAGNVAGYPEIYAGLEIKQKPDLTNPWSYDSGWLPINAPVTGHNFVHNLIADVFSSMVIQFKDANDIPLQIMGSMYGDDRAPGEYNNSYGPRCYMTDTNTVRVDVADDSAEYWLPPRGSAPVGWSTNQPTFIRLLLNR